jgi:hypothetical protein
MSAQDAFKYIGKHRPTIDCPRGLLAPSGLPSKDAGR